MTDPLRIGILYPLHSAEDDYPRLAAALEPPVELYIVHTDSPDLHAVEQSLITGSRAVLLAGADELKPHNVGVCIWACTSGSFVFGLAGAQRQANEIADRLGVPASSTSLAFITALQALGLTKVAVAATYPPDHTASFCAFLAEGGVEVVQIGCLGIWTGTEVGHVGREAVLSFAQANDHPDAEAIVIPDTALHTTAFLPELEAHTGKTVLTANQVSMWEALRLAGNLTPQSNLGALLSLVT